MSEESGKYKIYALLASIWYVYCSSRKRKSLRICVWILLTFEKIFCSAIDDYKQGCTLGGVWGGVTPPSFSKSVESRSRTMHIR
jgi:hypothetical protein